MSEQSLSEQAQSEQAQSERAQSERAQSERAQSQSLRTLVPENSTIAVVGAGQMGGGIAQVCAMHGYTTLLIDKDAEALKRAQTLRESLLQRQITKGTLTIEQVATIQGCILHSTALKDCAQADLVIEAIIENTDIKLSLFRELDTFCGDNTILASNTSSISITRLAAATKHPEQFIGLHFMNPVPVMKLVEVIRGLQTNDATYATTKNFLERISKTPVTALKDYPGFMVNRILIPMLNEATFALMEGIGSVEDIDTAMKLGTNQPMGPLELADFVGLDTLLSICHILQKELGDDKYRPSPLLVKYVEAGWFGKKSGRGFYQYPR